MIQASQVRLAANGDFRPGDSGRLRITLMVRFPAAQAECPNE